MFKKKMLILLSLYGSISLAAEFSTRIQVANETCADLMKQNAKIQTDSLGAKINVELHNATCSLYSGVSDYMKGKKDQNGNEVNLKDKCDSLFMTIDLSKERADQNKTILSGPHKEFLTKNISWATSVYDQLCDISYMNRNIITDSAIKIKIQKLNLF